MLQDLDYEKNDEVAAIAKTELELVKSEISREMKKEFTSCFRRTAKKIHNG